MRLVAIALLGAATAATSLASAEGEAKPAATRTEPDPAPPDPDRPDSEPGDAALADAPPPHQASGILHPGEAADERYAWINTVLAVPRFLIRYAFVGPELVIGEIDAYRQGRGPNTFNRGAEDAGWRTGALLEYRSRFGATVGGRLGYALADGWEVHGYGLFFGRHGQTVGAELDAGRWIGDRLVASVALEYSREREYIFAGVGDRDEGGASGADPYGEDPASEARYEERSLALTLQGTYRAGDRVRLVSGLRLARHEAEDDGGDDALSARFDTAMLPGFGEEVSRGFAGVAATYDSREPAYDWIAPATPSSGWWLHAAGGWGIGDGDRSGAFDYARYELGAARLFDLFRGNRVLSVRARVEGLSPERDEVPFMLLPSLGGPDRLRAFAAGRFRDRVTTLGELRYDWAIGHRVYAGLFAEAGAAHPGPGDIELGRHRLSFGGAMRLVEGPSSRFELQIAGSPDGDLGLYVTAGGL